MAIVTAANFTFFCPIVIIALLAAFDCKVVEFEDFKDMIFFLTPLRAAMNPILYHFLKRYTQEAETDFMYGNGDVEFVAALEDNPGLRVSRYRASLRSFGAIFLPNMENPSRRDCGEVQETVMSYRALLQNAGELAQERQPGPSGIISIVDGVVGFKIDETIVTAPPNAYCPTTDADCLFNFNILLLDSPENATSSQKSASAPASPTVYVGGIYPGTKLESERKIKTPSPRTIRGRTPSPRTIRGRTPSPRTIRGRTPSPRTIRGKRPSPKIKDSEYEETLL